MKKIIFLFLTIGILFLTAVCSAGTLQLTTYIPSPVGAFDRLRLVPRTALGLPCEPGTLYIENPNLPRFCQDDGLGHTSWTSFPGVWTQATNAIYPTDTDQVDPTADTVYVGIGTTTPSFKLTLEQDGGILAKGTFGSGATLSTAGAGTRFIWYPRKAALRAGRVTGTAWNDINIGNYSTAMGLDTTASNAHSMAFGDRTTANAATAVAFGSQTTAHGVSSMASGDRSQATGDYSVASGGYSLIVNPPGSFPMASGRGSVAIGNGVRATSDYSFAFGYHSIANNTAAFASGYFAGADDTNPIDIEGIGSFASGSWPAATGDYSFAVGNSPQALGDYSIAIGFDPVANGSGAVALGGGSSATADGAVALGLNNLASGLYAVALASSNQASGDYSLTLGASNFSQGGDYSIAMGSANFANGDYSVALGSGNSAIGDFSMATGWAVSPNLTIHGGIASGNASFVSGQHASASPYTAIYNATGDYAFCSGYNGTALGIGAVAMGRYASATGNYSMALGGAGTATGNGSTAGGPYSVALGGGSAGGEGAFAGGARTLGMRNIANGRYSAAFGTGMQVTGDFSVGFSLRDTTTLTYQLNQSHTVSIMGGNVGIGTRTPGYPLEVTGAAAKSTNGLQWSISSDARLKKNIKLINPNFALKKILKLRPVSFKWKEPAKHGNQTETQMGFVAQDVERVLPRWVIQDREGYKSLNLGGIDPLTVESLKALRQELNEVKVTYAKIIQDNNERLQVQEKTIETLKQKLHETQ